MRRFLPALALLAACGQTPPPPVTPAVLVCEGLPPAPLAFIEADPPLARLRWQGRKLHLPQVPAASGARYEGEGFGLWTRGRKARLERPGAGPVACDLVM